MKKILAALFMVAFTMTGAFAFDLLDNVKKSVTDTAKTVKQDVQSKTTSNLNSETYGEISLKSEMDKYKKQRDEQLAVVNKQISEKESQMRSVIIDTKLTISQKKSKTSLIQKEIDTLKAQKEQIQQNYRNQIKALKN